MRQNGFAHILVLAVIVIAVAIGGAYYLGLDHGFEKSANESSELIKNMDEKILSTFRFE